MPPNDALERLTKKLDTQNTSQVLERRRLPQERGSAPRGWKPPAEGGKPHKPRGRFDMPEMVFIASAGFFVLASLIALLLFMSGNNTVSTRNVDIAVSGPTEIGAGETLSLQVAITNRNAVPMQLTDLVIEFPEGTRSEADVSIELPRTRESLGTIEAGESVSRTIRAVVFGESGSDVIVKASVEYRVPSSNAVFVSEASYIAKLNKAPASIAIESLKEVVSGQSVSFAITISSNAPDTLSDMLLVAQYPPGFSFSSAVPAPATGSAVWNLGDIEPGGKRTVTISGTFSGEDGAERVVHFSAGSKKEGRDDVIAAPLASGSARVTITKPFLSLALALNGTVASDHAVSRGESVRGDIRWSNNLPGRVQDVEIELAIKGAILDRASVDVDKGFFRSGTQTIIWSKETLPEFRDVAPGASDIVSFSFATLPQSAGSFKNPELDLTVTVRARRISEENVPETIVSSAEAHVSVATDLALKAVPSRGTVFAESGTLPPKVDTETTYTVTWVVTNSTNEVANASVSAVLPSYVRWVGMVSPASESVAFNPVGGIVTWNVGDLKEGASRSVALQIAFTPSLSQVGTSPTLLSNQRVYGFDRFARSQIENTAPSITTVSFSTQSGLVVP